MPFATCGWVYKGDVTLDPIECPALLSRFSILRLARPERLNFCNNDVASNEPRGIAESSREFWQSVSNETFMFALVHFALDLFL